MPKVREANYMECEKHLLLELVAKHPEVASKKLGAVAMRTKNAAWETISLEFNSRTMNFPRKPKTLKNLWKNMLSRARKKIPVLPSAENDSGNMTDNTNQSADELPDFQSHIFPLYNPYDDDAIGREDPENDPFVTLEIVSSDVNVKSKKTHSGIHPLQCDVCGRSFKHKYYLDCHKVINCSLYSHMKKCKHCPFIATSPTSTLIHVQEEHPELLTSGRKSSSSSSMDVSSDKDISYLAKTNQSIAAVTVRRVTEGYQNHRSPWAIKPRNSTSGPITQRQRASEEGVRKSVRYLTKEILYGGPQNPKVGPVITQHINAPLAIPRARSRSHQDGIFDFSKDILSTNALRQGSSIQEMFTGMVSNASKTSQDSLTDDNKHKSPSDDSDIFEISENFPPVIKLESDDDDFSYISERDCDNDVEMLDNSDVEAGVAIPQKMASITTPNGSRSMTLQNMVSPLMTHGMASQNVASSKHLPTARGAALQSFAPFPQGVVSSTTPATLPSPNRTLTTPATLPSPNRTPIFEKGEEQERPSSPSRSVTLSRTDQMSSRSSQERPSSPTTPLTPNRTVQRLSQSSQPDILANHNSSRNDQNITWKCEPCEIVFSDNIMFGLHKVCHTAFEPFKCNICGKLCRDKYDFTFHITTGKHD